MKCTMPSVTMMWQVVRSFASTPRKLGVKLGRSRLPGSKLSGVTYFPNRHIAPRPFRSSVYAA